MKTYPETNVTDLFRLLKDLLETFLSNPYHFSTIAVLIHWFKGTALRYKNENIILNLFFKQILLVSGQRLSTHILNEPPSCQHYIEGRLKKKGMAFLAPEALTISHDEQWQRLRSYHEKVLCSHAQHIYQQYFFTQVQQAFSNPISTPKVVRKRMGQAMLGIVFGESTAQVELVEDIEILFDLVGNPVKRMLYGRFENNRRNRFYDHLRQLWRDAERSSQPSLLTIAHQIKLESSEEESVQQIPHWMFPFISSGSDLLTHTLGLIASRPTILERVEREITKAGGSTQPEAISQLGYLEACILETGRLYPPVTFTFHMAPHGDIFEDTQIPKGMEILHFFPLMQRNSTIDTSADRFEPERWFDPDFKPNSNLFLSGARLCPGKDLIMFVCKTALAILIDKHDIRIDCNHLSQDPLPPSFPRKISPFTGKLRVNQ